MARRLPSTFALAVATLLCLGTAGWLLVGPGRPTGARPIRLGRAQGQSFDLPFLERLTLRSALGRLGASAWHDNGARGKGIQVAVLDSGLRGYQTAAGKALPATVMGRSFRFDGNLEARDSQHGILCGEVVRAIAPEAKLLLANWEPEHPEQFLAAVRWARKQGARIISCSVIMPTWSDGQGGGAVHTRLARILGSGDRPGDMLLFASAGNTALRHWSGPFSPGRDGWHDWGRGRIDNAIHPYELDRLSVELYAPAGECLEVAVWDDSGREVGRSRACDSEAGSSAVIHFRPVAERDYTVRVRRTEGKGGSFHVVVLGGKLGSATRQGSIPFPGDGARVVTVGAVDAKGRRINYSSCGFPDGARDTTKPDLVAPVPFPSSWRPAQAFGGTSAATPQAAALAALIWAQHPRWTANQVRQALVKAARRPCLVPQQWETGHGVLHLPDR